ncbi:MAG: dehydratase [Bradyrhizobium sp.]|nr:MAG: dehydratase [Bradyrhizobium sp.]
MTVLFYEDFEIGQKAALGSHKFVRDATVGFARKFDPQPFHLDEAAGAASIFSSLAASGWHTASAAMRALVDYRETLRTEALARGETPPPRGLEAGVRQLRWSAPVRPGDELAFSFEVVSKAETVEPQWGLVACRVTGINQDGREACSYILLSLVARRP